jgi:uncharacterized membrane protein
MIIRDDTPQDQNSLPPAAGSSYSNGMNKLSKYFLDLLLIIIIVVVIGIPSWIGSAVGTAFGLWGTFEFVYGLMVTTPLAFGVAYACLKAARGEKPEIKDLAKVLENYWHILLANILCGVIVFVGFILFIIPGIYFLCKLAFVRYLVTEEKMTATEAINESWNRTDGYAFTIFLMALLAVPIYIGGLILFGVGVILSDMWVETSFASLYHAVSLEKGLYKPASAQDDQDTGPVT